MKTGVKVSDAMTRNPIFISPDKSIIECARKMKKHDIGSIVIKDGLEFLGFVTEHDLINLLTKRVDLGKIKVRDIMTPKQKVVSIEPNMDLYDASITMQDEEFKRLPVLNNKGDLVGLLTMKDLLKIQPQLFDLLVEKFDLKDESEKIFFSDGKEGICDICSTEGNIFNVRGKFLCRACRDSI